MAALSNNQPLGGWSFILRAAKEARFDGQPADPLKKLGRQCYAGELLEKRQHEIFRGTYREICGRAGKIENIDYAFTTDTFGNTFATYFGRNRHLPAVMMQSHMDSVPDGGIFDGPAGIGAALLFVERLVGGPQPLESFRIAVYSSEESSPHHGYACLGSAYATGLITLDEFKKLKRKDGTLLWDTYTPEQQEWIAHELMHPSVTKGNTRISFESHIEQGPHVAAAGKQIGIVDKAISGATRQHARFVVGQEERILRRARLMCRISFYGESNHTGTTPPNTHFLAREKKQYRHDALVAASYGGLFLLRDRSILLLRSETMKDTGYSTVPFRHAVDVLVRAHTRPEVERRLRKLRFLIDKKFGVRMKVRWRTEHAGPMTFLEPMAARRVLKIPVLANMLATRAYLRECAQNDLGDTRVTITDFHFKLGELRFKLDLREADREKGAKLLAEVHESLRRRFGGVLTLAQTQQKHSQPIDAELEAKLCAIADRLGISYKKMPSLAGHDTDRHIAAEIKKSAMLFYAQDEGVSHNCEENTTERYFDLGNVVVLDFLAQEMGIA